jgi:hypothetical protein
MEANHNLNPDDNDSITTNPMAGYIALTLGACSIFISGVFFCPFALVACLISFVKQEFFLGSAALILTAIGFITTPYFLSYLGWMAFYTYSENLWNEFLNWASFGFF